MKDDSRSALTQRIAQDLNEPEKILAAILSQRRKRPELETAFILPRSPLEAEIAIMCADILLLDRVGIDDNLLEFGIDSLGITQLGAALSNRFNIELSFETIFSGPSVAELARTVQPGKHPPQTEQGAPRK